MAKKKKNEVALECVQCKSRNYWTHKKSGPNPEKIELSKHCPRCNKHTAHKETKKSKINFETNFLEGNYNGKAEI